MSDFVDEHDWEISAACAGMDTAPWYPERGESASEALRICATCPVQRPCLIDSLTALKQHYASAEGVRGGIGGQGRRAMIASMADLDHHPSDECPDPDCRFCGLLRTHRVNLDVLAGVRPRDDRERIVAFGAGATHGRMVTYARGCRCPSCKLAISTVGKRLSAQIDVVDWLHWLLAPIPELEGSAPATTAEWAEVAAEQAEVLLAKVKHAASRVLNEAA